MVERIRQLLNRIPEKQGLVRQLLERNPGLNALCQESDDITQKLSRLEALEDPGALSKSEDLKGRRTGVEEELLARIEAYQLG